MISRFLLLLVCSIAVTVQADGLYPRIDAAVDSSESAVIDWRRQIHSNPELGNEEYETAALIAEQLRRLKFDEVETGVAGTGVVATLIGGKPGPVVALRADMDALPVVEATGLPFASTKRTIYQGKEVGVMHACGHDAHVAMLLGVAQVLASVRDDLPGTVKFIFQPAEEGADAESWGGRLMVEEGVLQGPHSPEAIFALHVGPMPSGTINYAEGPMMAGADMFDITVRGKQTHGAAPWGGVDPVIVAAESIVALQLIPSRHVDITKNPTIISIGSIHAGNRGNIIPDTVAMQGTLRTFDMDDREDIVARMQKTLRNIADTHGATAELEFNLNYPVTFNQPALLESLLPVMRAAAGSDNVQKIAPLTGSEDFSFFSQEIPGVYLFLGTAPSDPARRFMNHSPEFDIDESALKVGVKTLAYMSYEYMLQNSKAP
jgi:amidohydrolase